jgi:hypothetical protein
MDIGISRSPGGEEGYHQIRGVGVITAADLPRVHWTLFFAAPELLDRDDGFHERLFEPLVNNPP